MPVIVTTLADADFAGGGIARGGGGRPDRATIARMNLNAWQDAAVIAEANRCGHDRFVIAGLWTSVSVAGAVLSALDQGFEVYVVTDACGDISAEAHGCAVERMVQPEPGR